VPLPAPPPFRPPHIAQVKALPTKPFRVSGAPAAPKIAKVSIRPLNLGGFAATHHFGNPAALAKPKPAKTFVFSSPAKMAAHLKRIEDTAWLHPNPAHDARRMVQVLDLGETP
jgi:hypothetical protein